MYFEKQLDVSVIEPLGALGGPSLHTSSRHNELLTALSHVLTNCFAERKIVATLIFERSSSVIVAPVSSLTSATTADAGCLVVDRSIGLRL